MEFNQAIWEVSRAFTIGMAIIGFLFAIERIVRHSEWTVEQKSLAGLVFLAILIIFGGLPLVFAGAYAVALIHTHFAYGEEFNDG